MTKPAISMSGLGLMGEAMARRLIETGHVVTGFDIPAGRLAAAATFGVQSCLGHLHPPLGSAKPVSQEHARFARSA